MRRYLMLALIGMHLASMMSVGGTHCHDDACGDQMQHVLLDGSHDHSAPANADDGDGNDASTPHVWHAHSTDVTALQSHLFDRPTVAHGPIVLAPQRMAGGHVSPLLEPPSHA